MITSTATLLVTLLALYSHPTVSTRCIARRADVITAQADASAVAYGVPVALLISVGMHESALGCHPRSGGSWGAPISRTRRSVAGTSDHTASALALGFRRCRTTLGALSSFRCGLCRCGRLVGYTPADAMRLAARLEAGPRR